MSMKKTITLEDVCSLLVAQQKVIFHDLFQGARLYTLTRTQVSQSSNWVHLSLLKLTGTFGEPQMSLI